MKRPLVITAIAFILGILISESISDLVWGLIIMLLTALSLLFFMRKKIPGSPFTLLFIPFLLLGFFLHFIQTQKVIRDFTEWKDQTVLLMGAVLDEPIQMEGRTTFVLDVKAVVSGQQKIAIKNGRIRVNLYSEKTLDGLKYGSLLTLKTKIEKPSGKRNIGGFDYRRFLAARGISGTASVSLAQIRIEEGQEIIPLKAWGYGLRKGILEALYGAMPDKQASVMAGMLIGYTQDMPESMEESFRRAGLSHIMAVSGANIAFLLFPFMWLLRRLGFNNKWSSAISLPVMLFYVFATGMEASVVRAAIMAGVTLLGMILWRQTDIYCSMAFSVILILLGNTFMLFDPGFILSFAATLSLVLFYKPIYRKLPVRIPKWIRDSLAGSFSAQLGVIPYIAASFNTFSVVSLLANLIIVPVTGLLTVLGAVLSILWFVLKPLAQFVGTITALITDGILFVTQSLAQLPWAEIKLATPGILLIIGYYCILGYIRFGYPRLPLKPSRRILAISIAVYGFCILLSTLPSGKLELYFIDVGQGDSILIRTPQGRSLLIDGGGSPMDDESSYTGERIVVPLLYDLKTLRIDVMVATHGHADHIAGLKSVMDQMQVGRLVIADAPDAEMNELIAYAQEKGIRVERAAEGDLLYKEDHLALRALYPLDDKHLLPAAGTVSANELSLVTRLDYGEFSALFTGDIGFLTEEKLLEKPELRCDLIKVAHHGSKYSSGDAFIQCVNPIFSVISVGKNYFGHPSPEAEKRLGSTILYKTIRDGGILVTADQNHPDKVTIETVIQ